MERGPRKSLLFYRYLLSYLLIFLLPFTVISFSFYYISTNNVREAITNSNVEKLEQVRDLLDERLSELRNIAVRISLDKELTPYKLSQAYSGREGYYGLMNYQSGSSLVDILVLTFYDLPMMHSSKGTTGVDNLVKNIYPMAEKEMDLFIHDLPSIEVPTLKAINLENSGDKQEKVLAYICPIPPQSPYFNGAVIFFIREEKLNDLIATSTGNFKETTYIYHDESDTLLTATTAVPQELLSLSKEQLAQGSKIKIMDYNGENHTFVTASSQENKLSFVSVMPTKQFYRELSLLKQTIFIVLALTAIVGIIVTIILTKHQYRPIGQLIKVVNSRIEKGKDLDSIRETIEVLFQDTEELKRRIQMQRSYVLDQYLVRLLRGSLPRGFSLEELLPSFQLERRGGSFFVIKIVFPDRISEKSLEERERALVMLETVANKDCIAYGVELFNENAVALIVNTAEPSELIRKEFAQGLASGLVNQLKSKPTFGVGKVYHSASQINLSFVEASAAIEHNLFTDRNLVFFEDVTEAVDVGTWYSFEQELQLSQAIKNGNVEVATDSLESILRELREKKASTPFLKFMYYDLVNVVLKVNAEVGVSVSTDEISQLVEFNSAEDLHKNLLKLIEIVCEKIDSDQIERDEQINDDIIKFILDNFRENDMSLTLIANKFGLSASYLSRLIKEKTGDNFTQYVWNLRITEFKRELLTSDTTIKDLVAQIGYVDVANFTRKFRETEGLTPGQYRKKHSEPKDIE